MQMIFPCAHLKPVITSYSIHYTKLYEVSPSIIHKSDLGGVRLNIGSSQEVADAYDLMMLRIKKHAPNAIVEGIYVEKMAEKGLEVISYNFV